MIGRRGRPRRTALGAVALVLVAACRTPAAEPSEPAAEPSGPETYSLCPPAGGPIDPAITDEAVEVIERRLAELGVSNATVDATTCIDVRISASDDPDVGPALLGTGHVELLVVPPEQIGSVVPGARPPEGLSRLAADGEFTSAGTETGTSGSRDLVFELAPDSARALAAWSSANVGGMTALVVDGVVVAAPIVSEAITGGRVSMRFAQGAPMPVRAVAAMIASGPLPEEWAQPEHPQG